MFDSPQGQTQCDPKDVELHNERCMLDKMFILTDIARTLAYRCAQGMCMLQVCGMTERHKGLIDVLRLTTESKWPDGTRIVADIRKGIGPNGIIEVSAGSEGFRSDPLPAVKIRVYKDILPNAEDLLKDVVEIAKEWEKESKS